MDARRRVGAKGWRRGSQRAEQLWSEGGGGVGGEKLGATSGLLFKPRYISSAAVRWWDSLILYLSLKRGVGTLEPGMRAQMSNFT